MAKANCFLIAILFLILQSCGSKDQEKTTDNKQIHKVSVKEISLSGNAEVFTYSGSIEADNMVSIGFSVGGRVVDVLVEEGQRIHKGQVLATIEQDTYQNAFAVANASLEQAQDNFNRLEQLYKKRSLPERDFIAAKVMLAQSNANKSIAAKNLYDTRLYASFSGIVTKKLIEAGSTVAPGLPAFNIVKTDKVYAVAAISENDISALKIGASADIIIPSLSKKVSSTVTIINPQADNFSKTYTVKVRLNNADGKLLPGMITDVIINTGKIQNAVVIPSSALVRDADNINYVFIARPDNTAFKKRVTISTMTGTSDVVVKDGLQAGDKLIVAGQTNLEDGSAVTF